MTKNIYVKLNIEILLSKRNLPHPISALNIHGDIFPTQQTVVYEHVSAIEDYFSKSQCLRIVCLSFVYRMFEIKRYNNFLENER